MTEPAPGRGAFGDMLGNMYFTPGTVLLLVLCIIALATFVGFKVVRGQW